MTSHYKHQDLTKQHVLNLLQHYKSLIPKTDKYYFNDGREAELVHLEGTIPVPYKGQTYNIPLCLILLDAYPH